MCIYKPKSVNLVKEAEILPSRSIYESSNHEKPTTATPASYSSLSLHDSLARSNTDLLTVYEHVDSSCTW